MADANAPPGKELIVPRKTPPTRRLSERPDLQQLRRQAKELLEAIRSGNNERALALMESEPPLVRARHPVFDWTPLHIAARRLNARLVAWLLDHGADVMGGAGRESMTPLDAAVQWSMWGEAIKPVSA